jgi:hypothetical protein
MPRRPKLTVLGTCHLGVSHGRRPARVVCSVLLVASGSVGKHTIGATFKSDSNDILDLPSSPRPSS